MILGLDPGRDKCGLAVMKQTNQIIDSRIVDSNLTIDTIKKLCQNYDMDLIVMGNGTTSKDWYQKIRSSLNAEIPIVTIDESNSTLEARDRYWLMYPPQGFQKIIPQGFRIPPRPVDDIVAILLIERYFKSLDDTP